MQVLLGGSVFFRPGSKHIIYDVDNVTNTLDREMVGRSWTMTPDGLKDTRTVPARPEAAPEDSTKKGPVAADVWRGPKRGQHKPAAPKPLHAVTTTEDMNVELPRLLSLLNRLAVL